MTSTIARCAAIAVAASLALPAGALAHAGIKSRSPKAGSSVSAPRAVSVTFRARVLDANLSVRSASGATVSTGSGSLSGNKRRVRVALRGGLARGTYRATVRFLAGDGHAQQSTWTFTVR